MRFKNIFRFLNKKLTEKMVTRAPVCIDAGSQKKRGFTLIELMVVMFVSSLVATVVLVNFGDFTSQTEFDNTALDVALTIREAQVYGIGSMSTGGAFDSAYGVIFDTSTPTIFTLSSFNGSGVYYSLGDITQKKTIKIKEGFRISKVCFNNGVRDYCDYSTITMVFKRPNPDANIYVKILSSFVGGSYPNAKIFVERISDGSTKTINVTDTGQIYIN